MLKREICITNPLSCYGCVTFYKAHGWHLGMTFCPGLGIYYFPFIFYTLLSELQLLCVLW